MAGTGEARAGAGARSARRRGLGPAGIVVKALLVAAVLVLVKRWLQLSDLEFIETLPMLTALMGGVVFTLAIILAGVLADFKESERVVGELASVMRRLHADLALVAKADALAAMRRSLHAVSAALLGDLREGRAVRLRGIYVHVGALDAGLRAAAASGAASSQVRTVQVGLGHMVRIADRLEVIIETMFMRAGYYFAGVVVTIAIVALSFTAFRPVTQGLLLYGFAVFLLVGLAQLVYDLDNPFAGGVQVSTRQLEKVEAFLAGGAEPPA